MRRCKICNYAPAAGGPLARRAHVRAGRTRVGRARRPGVLALRWLSSPTCALRVHRGPVASAGITNKLLLLGMSINYLVWVSRNLPTPGHEYKLSVAFS